MKLNLLPTYVSKGAKAKGVMVASILFLVLSVLGCVGLIVTSKGARDAARTAMDEARPAADAAVRKAKEAEAIAAKGAELRRNVDLADSFEKHNLKYTEFYSAVRPYIPPYFRVNRMQVTPIDEKSCQLQLRGVLQSNQQYADIALAMLRIPGALNVSREGFSVNDLFLPGVTESDQRPLPHLVNSGRVPPLPASGPNLGPDARLAYLIAEASANTPTGFTGTGGFGDASTTLRTAMKGFSDVTINVLITNAAAAAQLGQPAPGQPVPNQPVANAAGAGAGLNVDFRVPSARETLKAGAAPAAGAAASAPSTLPGSASPGGRRGAGAPGEDF